tara:strand:- start:9040 stop:9474 length:435 start_codon:yes stop_codon:yes gene_type:complete
MVKIKVKKLRENAIIPRYSNQGDVGMDFYSCGEYCIKPGQREIILTGISTEFPDGYELQIRPRSGLAIKKGISIVNSPGTIDSGYRGEHGIILINHGEKDFLISPGDKIAQGVFNCVEIAEIEEAQDLEPSERGEKGFGSTDEY